MSKGLPIVYLLDASVAVTGAFIAARNAATALAESARVVLVLPANTHIPVEELRGFWRVEYLPIVNPSKNISAMLRYIPTLIGGAWRLRQSMRRDGATILMLNDFYLMHGTVLRALGFRGHIVSWVRGDPTHFAGALARPMLAFARRSANCMVAVSSSIRARLPARYRVDILYDCYTGTPRTPKSWRAEEEKIFLYVGNYIAGKGQDMALAAFAKAATRDATIQLHFHGGDMGLEKNRAYRKALENAAREAGLGVRVHFGDFMADTAPLLATAYAALNFSANESFSMTVLEASGAGLPVIATASGGPQEILQAGITGHLIPVGDVGAAAAHILALATNVDQASAMGQAGAAHVRQQFSPQTFRSQLQSVLTLSH